MPRLVLIYPATGKVPGREFVRTWQQEPLAIGVLAALTPDEWEISFFDDRMERIDYDIDADLVGISIETYTARRGYQIAARFRDKGIPVVFGGCHATFMPDEALEHGDAVCVGEAEKVWESILDDTLAGRLEGRYKADSWTDFEDVAVDRGIFDGKRYLPLTLVETGRGCPNKCEFCSISAFFRSTYRGRAPESIVREIKEAGSKYIFFVDDNFTGDLKRARELCDAVKPLKVKWMTQASVSGLGDPDFTRLMAESGCMALLIGFESLDEKNLASMNKRFNRVEDYSKILANLRENRIFVYGTFVFGYPSDTRRSFEESVDFAVREKMFIAAFNHLVPFPGTPLYAELESGKRLKYDKWWLSSEFRFGQTPFEPEPFSSSELEGMCLESRRDFFSFGSILRRMTDFKCNCATPMSFFRYFGLNLLMRKEVSGKFGIPLGEIDGPEV